MGVIRHFENLLYNSTLDLSRSTVVQDDRGQFLVRTRISPVRVALGLLFGVTCLSLLANALLKQDLWLLPAVLFCPPLAALFLMLGASRQEKAFIVDQRLAIKGYRLPYLHREISVPLPKEGVIRTYKVWSAAEQGKGDGCYFYHADVDQLEGFSFSVEKNEQLRDAFAIDLAAFLHYTIRDMDIPLED